MNKDLIIKLAKLANNNPNDNEANAAARKVCRLLAESNFDFGHTIERTKTPDFKSTYNPYEDLMNIMKNRNWTGFDTGFDRNPPPPKDRSTQNYYEEFYGRDEKIHQCEYCGHHRWYYDLMNNYWICLTVNCKCPPISEQTVAANRWRMK